MSRRAFLASAGALFAAPQAARGQQAERLRRVGLVLTTSPLAEMAGTQPVHPGAAAFLHELRTLGYIEGRNLGVERRSAEGRFERYPIIVAELARLRTEVIVAAGNNVLYKQARGVTGTVPFVMIASSEPDKAGLVESLARPGGNFTGLTIDGPDIEVKRLEFLRALLPGARRVAYLATQDAWEAPYALAARRASAQLGFVLEHAIHTPTNYSGAYALISGNRPDAIIASFSAETFAQREQIARFALVARLPGIFPYREMAETGGLMSYGMSVPDLFRRSAHYVDKILRGARPAELPIERPRKYELVINAGTARALGVAVPQSVLLRADLVIE